MPSIMAVWLTAQWSATRYARSPCIPRPDERIESSLSQFDVIWLGSHCVQLFLGLLSLCLLGFLLLLFGFTFGQLKGAGGRTHLLQGSLLGVFNTADFALGWFHFRAGQLRP